MPKRIFSNRWRLVLSALILFVLGSVVTIFVGYRRVLDKPDVPISSFRKDAQLSLDGVHQTSTRDGVKEWSLDAVSAEFNSGKRQALLKKLSVIFFLKDGKEVRVTADRGTLQTDSSDIEAAGDVVVRYGPYRLNTENLLYRHQSRVVSSQTPVKIQGAMFVLTADTLSFDLNTHIAILTGGVEGSIVGKFKL